MWSLCSGEQGLPRRGLPTWENVTTVMAFPCAPPLPPPPLFSAWAGDPSVWGGHRLSLKEMRKAPQCPRQDRTPGTLLMAVHRAKLLQRTTRANLSPVRGH